MQDSKYPSNYTGVQTLRFFAALLVVVHHATTMAATRMSAGSTWENGAAGVDIFFVISGFVMAISAAPLVGRTDGWSDFLTRRAIRVLPMYWIATTLKIAMILAVPAMAMRAPLDVAHVVASYLLAPWPDTTGFTYPVLTVGWTLTFEMFFYILVAAALLLRLPPLWFCAFGFVATSGAGLALGASTMSTMSPLTAFGHVLLSPIVLEFILGMLIAAFLRRQLLPAWLASVLFLLGGAALLLGDAHGEWRPLAWGLPAAAIVAAVVQLEPVLRRSLPKWLVVQGDASYSLYLFHTFLVPFVGVALMKVHAPYPILAIVICAIVAPAVAMPLHLWLEKPLTRILRRLTDRRRADGGAAPREMPAVQPLSQTPAE